MKTWIAAILGAASTLNGVFMLMAGSRWYETIPGVTHTGPFNPHFVADIGAAYLAGGLALAARAWRPRYWPAAVAGAGFFALHAIIHVGDIAAGHAESPPVDVFLVILPAALALWAAFPDRHDLL
jgi:hypothetical protein